MFLQFSICILCVHQQVLRTIRDQLGEDTRVRAKLNDQLAKSLLMRGKSLCNTALDGDCQDTAVDKAFEDAETNVRFIRNRKSL